MAVRRPQLSLIDRSSPARLYWKQAANLPSTFRCESRRNLHSRVPALPAPKPTPFVPNVHTFLTLIGRSLSQHASKIESWDTLFRLTSTQLRDLGIEPARTRKYLLRWRDKFQHGEYGIGGDAKYVGRGGAIECRLVEVTLANGVEGKITASLTRSPGVTRKVLNVPWSNPIAQQEKTSEQRGESAPLEESIGKDEEQQTSASDGLKEESNFTKGPRKVREPFLRSERLNPYTIENSVPIQGVHYKPGRGIMGSHMRIVKGTQGHVGIIEVKEGMWEHRRGQKVDGGERRKAEVRFKRRSAERRAARA